MRRACVICNSHETVKSHLLPAALGRDLRGQGNHFWIGTASRPGKTISQSGIYDEFLCEKHEQEIHKYEEYAIRFIRGFDLSEEEARIGVFRRDGTDNESLIRFVCSVFWRFHHSSRPEARHVDLGRWERNMRSVTFGGSVYQAPDVFVLAVHQTRLPSDAFMLTPEKVVQWGRNSLQFLVNGLTFIAKLDDEDWPPEIQGAVLNQTPDWIASGVFHWGERQWQAMKVVGGQMMKVAGRG